MIEERTIALIPRRSGGAARGRPVSGFARVQKRSQAAQMDPRGWIHAQDEARRAELGQYERESLTLRGVIPVPAGPFLEQEAMRIVHGQPGDQLPAGAVRPGQRQQKNRRAAFVLEIILVVFVDFPHGPLETVDAQKQAAVLDDGAALRGPGVQEAHEAEPSVSAVPVDLVLAFLAPAKRPLRTAYGVAASSVLFGRDEESTILV